MAKAKSQPVTETFVETAQDQNFADAESEPAPRGSDLESDIQAIREKRAAQRAAKGGSTRKRVITNYHDAERLRNLGLLTPDEVVDCEEAGLLPDPAQFATGSSAQVALNVPPDEVE